MASTYKTPGVYVEEISLFPPSVAQVETAIPAFIGYTEKAEKDGSSIVMIPTEITSLLEFKELFGGEYTLESADFEVWTNDSTYEVQQVVIQKYFYMYDCIRTFFDNGGGKCYIVSVDLYANVSSGVLDPGDSTATPPTGIVSAIKALENYDDPTMIVMPDAVRLAEDDFYTVQQMAIAQCAKLQDRVTILDLHENFGTNDVESEIDWSDAVDNFRDNIGINNLDYSAAYTPWIYSTYNRDINYRLFKSQLMDSTGTNAVSTLFLSSDSTLNAMVSTMDDLSADQDLVDNTMIDYPQSVSTDYQTIEHGYSQLKADAMTQSTKNNLKTKFKSVVSYVRGLITDNNNGMKNWLNFKYAKLLTDTKNAFEDETGGTGFPIFGNNLIAFEKNADVLAMYGTAARAETDVNNDYADFDANPTWLPSAQSNPHQASKVVALATDYGDPTSSDMTVLKTMVVQMFGDLDVIFAGIVAIANKIDTTADTYYSVNQKLLYQNHSKIKNIAASISTAFAVQPPSAAMAGVYAAVDNSRGVWKAPANVSLASVSGPSAIINDETQADLNVDTTAGKSINAIRKFTGKGTLVWGARTLDGNSNEWRYISVRRFFNMVEESVKKSTSPFVFEPNDANTWVKVKGMIENYLTLLWREGALAGAKPEQAFFVKVGLGITMTAQDILEGRMNVEIGMAAVRPAEFIILKFSHKMQES